MQSASSFLNTLSRSGSDPLCLQHKGGKLEKPGDAMGLGRKEVEPTEDCLVYIFRCSVSGVTTRIRLVGILLLAAFSPSPSLSTREN